MPPPFPTNLATPRLTLRPFGVADAERVVAIQSDWNVTRMLRMATWPPDLGATRLWLAGHQADWLAGTAYRFAITLAGDVIGCADIDEIAVRRGSLGYWLANTAWGQGFASEAGTALLSFAFDTLDLKGLDSGHASDNPASGAVLRKLGFLHIGDETLWSEPRQAEITQWRYRRER